MVHPYLHNYAYGLDVEEEDFGSIFLKQIFLDAPQLPWDKPTPDCPQYGAWKECQITRLPWTKIDTLALSLLRKLLMPIPSKRYTIAQIKNHQWFLKKFKPSSEYDENQSHRSCEIWCYLVTLYPYFDRNYFGDLRSNVIFFTPSYLTSRVQKLIQLVLATFQVSVY